MALKMRQTSVDVPALKSASIEAHFSSGMAFANKVHVTLNNPSRKNVMKALTLIGTLLLLWTANSVYADVIRPYTVDPASIKVFEYKGKKATVSSNVPQEVYGEYRLDIASGRAAVASRTITLNEDGTGKAHNYGNNEAPKSFEWGVLVNEGVTEITVPSITHKWWVEAPLNKDTWSEHAYVVVLKFDSGEHGFIFVFEQEGVMIIPGPAGMGIWKY